MKRVFQIGSLVVLFIAIAFAGWVGVFRSVDVVKQEVGPFTFVYEDYVGPFKNIGPVFARVESQLRDLGIEPIQGMGVYFDDPKVVPQDKLRSQCGALVDESASSRVEEMQVAHPALRLRKIAKTQALVVEFPLRAALSLMVAPSKAYPAIQAALVAQRLTVNGDAIELYDHKRGRILVVMPVR